MYIVFGYDDMCRNFKFVFNSFVAAIKAFDKLKSGMNVVFFMRETPGTCKAILNRF